MTLKFFQWPAIGFGLPALILFLADLPVGAPQPYHSPAEWAAWRSELAQKGHGVLTDSTTLFPLAQRCGFCHGYDSTGLALVTTDGRDVNIFDDWRSSMMANSAKDPFWRAKVMHEVMTNPAHATGLEDKCTSCHAPAGHYQAKIHDGALHYAFATAITDTLGLDGVTCQACHAQAPGDLGSLHSGQLNFDPDQIKVAYGPYLLAYAPPMIQSVGIMPKYGEHIHDAGLCAGCHTLLTASVDLQGNYTGSTFVEQATYHEWLNSRYDKDQDNITCQGCHLPQLQDEIIISARFPFLTPKSPYGLHEMVGANVSMLQLLKENRVPLTIKARPEHFDSTIQATMRMLQEQTLDLQLAPVLTHGDTAYFDLRILNKAGHKFPSGYPSRRAWVEFLVTNADGLPVFHSGAWTGNGQISGEDTHFEPHHQVIDRPQQVQIYEMVPGDVNGQFTTVLEQAHLALKDNRLTPQGFSLTDPAYDTTRIVGAALDDPDFNRNALGETGTGADVIHFRVPINGYFGVFHLSAKIWYQSVPPKWVSPMFALSNTHIDQFETMYNNADMTPVLIKSVSLDNIAVSPVSAYEPSAPTIKIYPTLTTGAPIQAEIPAGVVVRQVMLRDAQGRCLVTQTQFPLQLPAQKGVYWLEIHTNRGRKIQKVVKTE